MLHRASLLTRPTLALAAVWLWGCNSSQDPNVRVGDAGDGGACPADVPDACRAPAPSFSADVLPIIESRCSSCHSADGGQWPLDHAQDIIDWEILFVSDLENCKMPPADAGTLPSAERETLLDWIACGAQP